MIIGDNFCYFCTNTYVKTPLLSHLYETVQMRGHNMFLSRDGSEEGSQHMF